MISEPMAKSQPPMTLREHTRQVMEAAAALADALKTPLLEVTGDGFADKLRTAAFCHDLGKAASGFQEAVNFRGDPKKRPRWGYRHETLSTAILLALRLEDPLGTPFLAAVLTHHRPLDDGALIGPTGASTPRAQWQRSHGRVWKEKIAELEPHWQWLHAYVQEATEAGWIASTEYSLPDAPLQLPDLYDTGEELQDALQNIGDVDGNSHAWILARGFLMAADHLASSELKLPLTELDGNEIRMPEGFQGRVAQTRGSALLEAPTGSGKTEAALHWALQNRRGGERFFYVLPHQASINKMDQRLKEYFGEESVGILHGRATLQEFHRTFDEEIGNYCDASTQAKATHDATKQFYRPVKVLTPFQLLKLMFGCRYFEIGLAELLGGLVIFDEIHAYDAHTAALLDVLVARLRSLQVRFLFMTATFPDFLKTRLQNTLGGAPVLQLNREHPRDADLLNTARHRLQCHESTLESLIDDIAYDAQTKTVLVVCNRVRQAQEIYRALQSRVSGVSLLHSRFIARDRFQKENQLIAFPDAKDSAQRMIPQARVLVSTQVVEVSLNVSFDTIYSEAAPVDALLQRFGRVNRLNQHGAPVPVHIATKFEQDSVKFIYGLDRIQATLTNAPNGKELFPEVEREWVQATYVEGYNEKEKEQFNEARANFENTVARLKPCYRGDDSDFEKLFDSYNIVPIRFKPEFRRCIAAKEYFLAQDFIASIPTSTFMQMQKHSEWDADNFVHYLDRLYDDDLGLLNEDEPNRSHLQAEFAETCF